LFDGTDGQARQQRTSSNNNNNKEEEVGRKDILLK
jgi:hypothetical protein